MKNKIIFFSFVLFSPLLFSACSKDLKIKDTKDYLGEKIALQEKLDLLEQQKQSFTLPSRVRKLNINTPDGLTLNKNLSYQTSEDVEGFNSMRFVYTGDYDIAMKQAEIMAQEAGIAISEEFKMAQDIVKQMGSGSSNQIKDLMGDLKGIVYTNYSLTKNPESDNIVSISVEEDGTLEIVVTDRKNMQNIVSNKLQ